MCIRDRFQPSEIAKLAVVIYFADSISKKKDRMQTFRYGIAPYAVLLIVLAALVLSLIHIYLRLGEAPHPGLRLGDGLYRRLVTGSLSGVPKSALPDFPV